MTEKEFESIKRNVITLAEQTKLTGEIPKPFDHKKYYDKEKQRIFLEGVYCGLNIVLNILTATVTRDELYKAQYQAVFEELSPDCESEGKRC